MKKLILILIAVFSLNVAFGQSVIISEVADPGDNYLPRFVEIYNATSATVDLTNWQIRKYVNGSTTSDDVSLSGTIDSGASITIAYNIDDFNSAYGFDPDFSNGNISGNGDDVYELTDGTNTIDIYGVIGTDGTGEDWDYEDSIAVRNSTICSGNTTWTNTEWTIISPGNVADATPNTHTCDCPSSVDTDSDATNGTQPAAATISSTITNSNDAIEVFVIDILDWGTADGLPTNVTNIRIKKHTTNTADWTDTIQGFTIYDDNASEYTPAVSITDNFIDFSFTSGDLVVADSSSLTLTFYVYLNTTNIVDGSVLSFMVDADDHGFTADSSGSTFVNTMDADFNSNDFTIEVTATELQFIQQPTDVEINTIMTPAVTVAYTDANGNIDVDANNIGDTTANLTASGATLSSSTTTTNEPTNGVMTFSDIQFDDDANGVTLTVTDNDVILSNSSSVTSTLFDVTPPPPPCSNLFISEYAQATNKHYLEIYNPFSSTIDINNYQIWIGSNGGSWSSATIIQLGTGDTALDDVITSDVYVIANNYYEAPFANQYDTNITFDGNDNIGLAWNGGSGTTYHLIDAIGDDQGDPGIGWDVAGVTNATYDLKLVRKPEVSIGNTDWTASAGTDATDSEWYSKENGARTQYSHSSLCNIEPIIGVVGGTSGEDYSLIPNESLATVGTLTPNTYNLTLFGEVLIGENEQHLYVAGNAGIADLELNGSPTVSISGADASDFIVTLNPSTPIPVFDGTNTYPPNNTSLFMINFTPTSPGVKTATVTIVNNTIHSPYTFTIQGTGVEYFPCDREIGKTIFLHDFETAGGYTTSMSEQTDNASDYFTRTDGTDISATFSAIQGSYYFAAQDLNENGMTTPATLTFDDISIDNAINLTFSIYIAEDDDGSNQDWDVDDFVHIDYDFDNSGTFTPLLWIENNGDTYNSAPMIDTDFDGTGDGAIITDTFVKYDVSIPVTGNLLDIKITFSDLESNEEDIAIDNIKLTGDTIVSTTWYYDSGTDTYQWSNGVPTKNTKAIIDADYDTSTASIEACACQVNSGATLTVNAGEHLLIETDFENDGIVEVLNEGSIVQHKKDAIITGTDKFKIHKTTSTYASYDYIYWSSPLNAEIFNNVFADNISENGRVYTFNTANFDDSDGDTFDDNNDDWSIVDFSSVMNPGTGYIAMGTGSTFPLTNPLTFTNQTQSVEFNKGVINNGDITVPLVLDAYNVANNGGDSFNTNSNLVGNPYPSAIDIKKLASQVYHSLNNPDGVLEGTFYFWTHDDPIGSGANDGPDLYNFSSDDYSTVTVDNNGVFSAAASSNQEGDGAITATEFIASGQGFLANARVAGNLVFTNAMRITDNNNTFRNTNTETELDRIWLNLTNDDGSIFRQIMVGFHDKATDGFANGQDGQRAENGSNTDFYSVIPNDDRRFAIQNLGTFNDSKTIDLGIEIIEDGIYNISIDNVKGIFTDSQTVYLEDLVTNTIHNLTDSPYQFTAVASDNNNRFVLRFTTSALSVDGNTVTTQVIVYQNGEFFNIRTSNDTNIKFVNVYNTLGQELGNYKSNSNTLQIPNYNINTGTVLFIKTTLDNDTVITKKVIKL